MKIFRLTHCLWITPMLLASGCHLTITVGDGPIGDDKTSVLPDPKPPNGQDPGGQGPPLDEAQQARADEAAFYIANVTYQGATILQAIQLPSGDIIDGLDTNTLPALPYPLPAFPWTPDALQLPPGVEFGVHEFEQYAELLDLVTTSAPFRRPDFSAYIMGETDASSIDDYLARCTQPGAPSVTERLYAGLPSVEPNRGVWGYMNQFHPKVQQGTFSVMEFAVVCPAEGPPQEQIGIVISVDKYNAIGRGGQPRLHIEYATMKSGKRVYNWDGWDGKFVWNPFRRHQVGEVVPVSVLAGTQVEHLMGIVQVPGTGDWWIAYNDEWLGHYPANLFTILNSGACRASWYGEVFRDPILYGDSNVAVKTEMGSGQPGSAGPLLAAYVRNPQYFDPYYWYPVDAQEGATLPEVFACYSREKLQNGITYFGGEGGYNQACMWPKPPNP